MIIYQKSWYRAAQPTLIQITCLNIAAGFLTDVTFLYQIHGVVNEVGGCVIICHPRPSGTLKGSQTGVDRANLHRFSSCTAAILFGRHFNLVETIKKKSSLGIHSRIWNRFYRKTFGFINIHATSVCLACLQGRVSVNFNPLFFSHFYDRHAPSVFTGRNVHASENTPKAN